MAETADFCNHRDLSIGGLSVGSFPTGTELVNQVALLQLSHTVVSCLHFILILFGFSQELLLLPMLVWLMM